MYSRRVKIFVGLVGLCLLGCILRLGQMQLVSGSTYRERIEELKRQRSRYRQLKTIRGRILDRKGRVLATDAPQFELCISYELASLIDERVDKGGDQQRFLERLAQLRQMIEKCARFQGVSPAEVVGEIRRINDLVWARRAFQAWRRRCPDSELLKQYRSVISVPLSEALAEFEATVPDEFERRRLINRIDIVEMHRNWPLLKLEDDDDIFAAQLEFDMEGFEIRAVAGRSYPYRSVAAQTIGWVGRPGERDRAVFRDDKLASYTYDDLCGREDGTEYVCEAMLRGRRGEAVYDIDRRLVRRIPRRFGRDVRLSIDIELQRRVEQFLGDCDLNPNCRAPTAAVVIDVSSSEVLVLASMPTYDLNLVRFHYPALAADANQPLRNRAINKQYPPGSVIKPLILIAGLESGKVTPEEVISCPARKAPAGWPNCWLFNRYGLGHDDKWSNYARNAIKGSCNVYFSRLASRIEPAVLQQWLFRFGYGRQILFPPEQVMRDTPQRNFRQAPGRISTAKPPNTEIFFVEQLPKLASAERRYFGIGQGNLRVTPLQVANAMAAIARGGLFMLPRLFLNHSDDSPGQGYDSVRTDLGISERTLAVVRDGMGAVVNEPGGTAYRAFTLSGFSQQGVTVYGKTGSTEKPYNAWFAGFAEDSTGRAIALAVVVEGGQHGSSDAAPLARDIIQFCIDAGYLGQGAVRTTAATGR